MILRVDDAKMVVMYQYINYYSLEFLSIKHISSPNNNTVFRQLICSMQARLFLRFTGLFFGFVWFSSPSSPLLLLLLRLAATSA